MNKGMRMGVLGLLLLGLAAFAVSGCGQKGDLYLPDESEQQEGEQ